MGRGRRAACRWAYAVGLTRCLDDRERGTRVLRSRRIFYGWWIVAGGFVIQMLVGALLFHPFGLYIVKLEEEFGWSRSRLSIAFSLARVEDGLLGPLQGWMLDRFGPRIVMAAGVLIFGFGFFAFARMNSLTSFYVTFVIMAIGAALAGFLSVTVALVNWFVRRRTLAVGIGLIGVAFGGLLQPGMAALLDEVGWRGTSIISGVVVLAVGLPASLLVRHRPEPYGLLPDGDIAPPAAAAASGDAPSEPTELAFTPREALRSRAFWLISAAHAAALLVVSAVQVHFVAHVKQLLDYSSGEAALFISVLTVMTIAGQLSGGWLGVRFSSRLLIAICMLGHGAALLLLTFASAAPMVLGFTVLHGLAWGVRGPVILSMRAEYFGRASYGMIMGLSSLVVATGMVIGPVLAGAIYDATGSYEVGFTIIAAVAAVSSLLMVIVSRPRPPTRSVPAARASERAPAAAADG
ncbi:MAG: MFS transporter [Chloroflexi bacterium]|nr:MFS transporter [Chloroflexota bacterium]